MSIMTTKPNSKLVGYGLALVAIVIILNVAAAIIPTTQSAGDDMGEIALCNVESGCLYNVTANATTPCRDSTNQSNECSIGQPSIPLSDIFSSTGLVFVVIMASLFYMVYRKSN